MSKSCCKVCVPKLLIIFLGLIFGIASAYAWFFGYIEFVRDTIPYAYAIALVLLILTSVLKAKCGSTAYCIETEEHHVSPTCLSVCKYSSFILFTSALFIVFSLIQLATNLSVIVKFSLGLIGAVSFWIMLFAFISMIYCIYLKCKK
ncbi:MAG TPA: hypothetical protein DCP51_03685 [Clostridiales bacterium]|nr:hypothetical protein [Clostridiales bacterium]